MKSGPDEKLQKRSVASQEACRRGRDMAQDRILPAFPFSLEDLLACRSMVRAH